MKADRRKTVSQCLLDFIVPNMLPYFRQIESSLSHKCLMLLIIQVRYDNFDLSMYC